MPMPNQTGGAPGSKRTPSFTPSQLQQAAVGSRAAKAQHDATTIAQRNAGVGFSPTGEVTFTPQYLQAQRQGQLNRGIDPATGRSLGTPTAPAAGGPSEFAKAFTQQFGEGHPFKMQEWYGGNPLETARDLATRELGKELAGIRARYGASGFGNSAREAIAEGTALGEFGTGLGDVMAARGQAAQQSDLDRLANLFLGAGQQNLAAQQLGLMANQQLAGQGAGLTEIGQGEQQIPAWQVLAALTGISTGQFGGGRTSQTGQSQSGFLGF